MPRDDKSQPPRRGRAVKRIVIACLVVALAVWLVLLIRLLLPQVL